jgi:putative tricarboxylic transport membrane protein
VGNNDTVSGLVCLLIGLSFVAGGVAMGLGPLNAPGAGFFPAVIGGIFSLLSGALFLKVFLKEGPAREKKSFWREERSWVRVSLSLCALLFYLFSLNNLGYILTTTLFILFLLKSVGKKGWKISVSMAVVASLASYALFRIGLGVLLPKGWIGM